MSNLPIIKDNSTELNFRQNQWVGLLFFLIGVGILFIPYLNIGQKKENLFLLYVVAGVLSVVGLLTLLYRLEVKLNIAQRRFEVTKGFWPNPKKSTGSFDQLSLKLKKKWQRTSGKNNNHKLFWKVGLKINSQKKPIYFYSSTHEDKAIRELEKRAKSLQLSTIDTTGKIKKERNWNELDNASLDNLSHVSFKKVQVTNPPQELTYQTISGGVSFTTKPKGYTSGVKIGIMFGTPFFLMGLIFIALGLELHELFNIKIKNSASMISCLIGGTIFSTLGGSIIYSCINFAKTYYKFLFFDKEFYFVTFRKGVKKEEKRLKNSCIEEFDVRDNTLLKKSSQSYKNINSDESELYIRSNTETVVVRNLNTNSLTFLKNVYYTLGTEDEQKSSVNY